MPGRSWGSLTTTSGRRSGNQEWIVALPTCQQLQHLPQRGLKRLPVVDKPATVQVKMAKLPSDINIRIEEHAMRFITDQKKKVDLRGPVFLTVRSELDH